MCIRDSLSGERDVHAERGGRAALRRSRAGSVLADAGHGHLTEGRGMAAACRADGGNQVIIVDTALRAREAAGNPIRVGMVGCGFMGRGVANQIVNSTPGMALVAIANRHVETCLLYTSPSPRDRTRS